MAIKIKVHETYLIDSGKEYREFIKPYEKRFTKFLDSEKDKKHRKTFKVKDWAVKDSLELVAYLTLNYARLLFVYYVYSSDKYYEESGDKMHTKKISLIQFKPEKNNDAGDEGKVHLGISKLYGNSIRIPFDKDKVNNYIEFNDFLLGMKKRDLYVETEHPNLTAEMIEQEAVRIASGGLLENGLCEEEIREFRVYSGVEKK